MLGEFAVERTGVQQLRVCAHGAHPTTVQNHNLAAPSLMRRLETD